MLKVKLTNSLIHTPERKLNLATKKVRLGMENSVLFQPLLKSVEQIRAAFT